MMRGERGPRRGASAHTGVGGPLPARRRWVTPARRCWCVLAPTASGARLCRHRKCGGCGIGTGYLRVGGACGAGAAARRGLRCWGLGGIEAATCWDRGSNSVPDSRVAQSSCLRHRANS